MQLTEALKMVFIETAQTLTGAVRRLFMASLAGRDMSVEALLKLYERPPGS